MTVAAETRKTALKEAIRQTIVFFDIFSHPLTAFEIWQNLPISARLIEIEELLDDSDGAWEKGRAYYFLPGRHANLATRSRRYNYAQRKYRRARRVSCLLGLVPWIRLIAVGNSIGADNLRDASDIDFFIVSDKKRIWLTRFICAFAMKALLLRPKVNDARDKICLSFYVSEEAMELAGLRLPDGDDPYFRYWLRYLCPLFSRGGAYEELIVKNSWLGLPNWQSADISPRRAIAAPRHYWYREFMDLFFGGLETDLRKFQLRILPPELKERMNQDTCVVVNDRVLKLHVTDRRGEFRSRFFEMVKK